MQKVSLNSSSEVKESLQVLMGLHSEIPRMEEVFKRISKCFQLLVKELSKEDIEKMMANLQSLKNVHAAILKNIKDREDLESHLLDERIHHVSTVFTETLNRLRSLESKALHGKDAWDKFHEAEGRINDWISQAESYLGTRSFESDASVAVHKAFFQCSEGQEALDGFLRVSRDLGPHIQSIEDKNAAGLAIHNIEAKWKVIREGAPLHLIKAEFSLNEDGFTKDVKEIEKYMLEEGLAFQKGKQLDIQELIKSHNDFFASGEPVLSAEGHLIKLKALSEAYASMSSSSSSSSSSNPNALHNAYNQRSKEWEELNAKRNALFSELEKVPEQWNVYELKFKAMSDWMTALEASLERLFREEHSPSDFLAERDRFEALCRDIDDKREDMQWLVGSLNTLMSHRPNEEGLAEQGRLEALVARYKGMIPLIDETRQKIDVHSRSYQFKSDVTEVKHLLDTLTKTSQPSISDAFSKEDEALILSLISEQEAIVQKLESYRSPILKLLQQGKDLQKHKNCPTFLREVVKDLETTWNDAYALTVDRLKTFKDGSRIWAQYVNKRNQINALIRDTKGEFMKPLESPFDHEGILKDLKAKRSLREDVKAKTGDLLRNMKLIVAELETVSMDLGKSRLDNEITDLELDLQKLFNDCDEKLDVLTDLDLKWSAFNKGIGDLKEWVSKSKSQLGQISGSNMSPEDRLKLLLELKNEISGKTGVLSDLEKGLNDLLQDSKEEEKVTSLRKEVESVRRDVSDLENEVSKKNESAQKELDNWNEYRSYVNNEIKPSLERAELRIAVGLTRPHCLEDVKTARSDIASFEDECNPIQERLETAARKMSEIDSKASADHEMDALKSKWHSVKSTLDQWNKKMESLEKLWEKFNSDAESINAWLEGTEAKLIQLSEQSSSDPVEINKVIGELKDMAIQLAQKQSVLLNLTQDCDSICLNLNHEGVLLMREKLSNIKSKMSHLNEENRRITEKISDSFAHLQDFQFKVDGFEAWMKGLESSLKALNEIPVDNINSALDTTHDLSQQHQDKRFDLDKIKKELDEQELPSSASTSTGKTAFEKYSKSKTHMKG
ncbi:Nesprin1like [Caligus rogercresseyi]|uniref:Nesprin1like n=1 Tax=Caligus rogercresseyi TaxID=217165 RepID=A0A7T8GLI7_CALRO|nr:Nesprin1like [Caligus rogercresseyi]